MRSIAILVVGLACSATAFPINKCTAKDGKVTFQDAACPLDGARGSDPIATGQAPRGNGQLTPGERKAIVDQMNAEIAAGIVKRDRERERAAARQAAEEAARPKPTTTWQAIDFEACRTLVARSLLAVAGTTRTFAIVNSPEVTMHKICTADGSVILTCSAEDRRLGTTVSPYQCP
ncbi:hypothetical protein [Piscinibacter defluvii]|uniref:hypothetical protein n=1 Tax=Piscinibacter defluvii TaxID=1796922 RepID=UPI000FDCF34D|nr:hypothetical protein [Piscinibacter defluvii]